MRQPPAHSEVPTGATHLSRAFAEISLENEHVQSAHTRAAKSVWTFW